MQYLIILTIILWLLFKYFSPNIEIIQIGQREFRVLLWYNHYEGIEIKRKWIKLFEYEQR
jgi:hypothetical protein